MRRSMLAAIAIVGVAGAIILSPVGSRTQCPEVYYGFQAVSCSEQPTNLLGSWRAWVQGKSISTRFHFLDFAELLFSKAEDTKPASNRNENNSHH
ncbi:MAG: hypothetical protein JJU10_00960 [Idiomarina sp.]|nr:hypothetical protein [Idiomarina sp.]